MSTRGIRTAAVAAASVVLVALSAGSPLAFPKPKYPVELPPKGESAPAPRPSTPAPPPAVETPVAPRPPVAPPKGAPDTLVYTVVRGDTLTGVGRRFTVGVARIAQLNSIDPAAGLAAGTRLRLPPGARDGGKDPYAQGPVSGGAPQVTDAASTVQPRPPVRVAQTSPAPVSGLRPPIAAPASATPSAGAPAGTSTVAYPTPGEVAALGRGRFVWPVKGEILSPYNPVRTDLGNDGLNIGADAGAGVHAAAAGFVVYAGDYPGFGNLVLVKHSDGWVTAYGHLESIEVRMRDHVDQGQEIGRVGETGGVTSPQLHFEIRYAPTPREKARPVDPDLLLPRQGG